MIRINLLAEKKQVKRQGPAPMAAAGGGGGGGGSGQSILLVGILLLGVAIAGGWWFMLNGTLNDWEKKHREADAEIARLQEILKKADKYEREKELLSRKIDLITGLKKKQEVPVQILDQISRNLPSFVWLESVNANQNSISITGKATNYNSVANFYENLSQVTAFTNVNLGRTYEVTEGVAFSLKCAFAESDAAPSGDES